MATIASSTGVQVLTAANSTRPRKGEGVVMDPGFASLLALLASGVTPVLPPAGTGSQPQQEPQTGQNGLQLQLPAAPIPPGLDLFTQNVMQAALEQMGPALLDGAGASVPAPQVLPLSDSDGAPPEQLQEADGVPFVPAPSAPAGPLRRPELLVLPRTFPVVERVSVGKSEPAAVRPEQSDQVQTAPGIVPVPEISAPERVSAAESGLEPVPVESPSEPEAAEAETSPEPSMEWAPASPAGHGRQTEPAMTPPPTGAAGELPAPLRNLAGEPIAPERLMAALREVAAEAEPGAYEVTLRLSPESLGEVKVTLQVSGSEVRTVMEVVGADARQALESGADRLRQGLSQAGLTLSGFQVNTGLGGQQGRDSSAEWPDWLRPPARRRGGTSSAATTPMGLQATASLTRTTGGRLDTLA